MTGRVPGIVGYAKHVGDFWNQVAHRPPGQVGGGSGWGLIQSMARQCQDACIVQEERPRLSQLQTGAWPLAGP